MGWTTLRMGLIRMLSMAGKFKFACQKGSLLSRVRDNEKPVRQAKVHAFQAQGRPISNEEVNTTRGLTLTGMVLT